jgi:hypothetical protein
MHAHLQAAHGILQETVGIAIVPEPNQPRRLDLPTLQAHVAEGSIPVDVATSVECPKSDATASLYRLLFSKS